VCRCGSPLRIRISLYIYHLTPSMRLRWILHPRAQWSITIVCSPILALMDVIARLALVLAFELYARFLVRQEDHCWKGGHCRGRLRPSRNHRRPQHKTWPQKRLGDWAREWEGLERPQLEERTGRRSLGPANQVTDDSQISKSMPAMQDSLRT